jgi:2-C-methyl-D-erythritol 4-phosphate cytidylyltransferase/2-C-methyl-D-erythritol 2,4-cyclodiphosphate synthase
VASSLTLPANVAIVPGGARRQESVAAGLLALDAEESEDDEDRVVLVHDGARPLATPDLAERIVHAAAEHGAAIPVVSVAETLKRVGPDGRVGATVDREGLAAAQTPQGFRRSVLRAAFAALSPDGPTEWTDEAALCEACRIPVHAIPGEPTNLKVTVPADLAIAEALLAAMLPPTGTDRVGLGRDSHPFGPGQPLALGGILIEGAPRLYGHSDGDVALHAIADALLGGAGLGDLGRLFPAGPSTPRGIASMEIIGEVRRRTEAAGLRARSVDVTIVAARPHLADWLDAMRSSIAALLGLSPSDVSVKASTGNLAGMEGAGRGISAIAIAVLEPIATKR